MSKHWKNNKNHRNLTIQINHHHHRHHQILIFCSFYQTFASFLLIYISLLLSILPIVTEHSIRTGNVFIHEFISYYYLRFFLSYVYVNISMCVCLELSESDIHIYLDFILWKKEFFFENILKQEINDWKRNWDPITMI